MSRFKTWQLFAICVVVWGTTWHAITYQLFDFSAEVGVALRFALAGLAVLALCRWRGMPLACSLADHGALALQGVFLYGVSYVCVYHAERFVPSGLVAVGYSASPLIPASARPLLFGAALSLRFVAGGVLGVAGVVVIFWTEFTRASGGERAALGACSPSHRCCFRPSAAWSRAAIAGAASRSGRRWASAWSTAPSPPRRRPARSAAASRCRGGDLVALARLPRPRRLGADLRLLPDPAGPHRPRPAGRSA